jgi:hypothetical protein
MIYPLRTDHILLINDVRTSRSKLQPRDSLMRRAQLFASELRGYILYLLLSLTLVILPCAQRSRYPSFTEVFSPHHMLFTLVSD